MAAIGRKGIDVSVWQGTIEWKTVKAAGIDFAMIRLGRGDTGSGIKRDTKFRSNAAGAIAAGLDFGVYFYSYAVTVSQAQAEAEFVIAELKGYNGTLTYPIAFDLEDKTQQALEKTLLTDIAIKFCETIEKAGYMAAIYSSKSWLTSLIDMSRLTQFDTWVAQWSSKPTYTGSFGIWQYSSTGQVEGISGNVDLNIAYKDYPAIIKGGYLNGFTKPAETTKTDSTTETEISQWQLDGFNTLVAKGVISATHWEPKLTETITVGELFGILGKMNN